MFNLGVRPCRMIGVDGNRAGAIVGAVVVVSVDERLGAWYLQRVGSAIGSEQRQRQTRAAIFCNRLYNVIDDVRNESCSPRRWLAGGTVYGVAFVRKAIQRLHLPLEECSAREKAQASV